MQSLVKSLIPTRLWRTGRNLAAGFGFLPRLSGTHDRIDPADIVQVARTYFRDYCEFGDLKSGDLRDLAVLEVGPGNNLAVPLLLLAAGAKQVVSIDRFPSRPNPEQARAAYEFLLQGCSEVERQRCADLMVDGNLRQSCDLSDRLVYLWDCPIGEAPRRLARNHFDLILSRSTLEHVYLLEEAFKAMSHLVKKGGMMIHKVDLRSHEENEQSHPLHFLTHSPFWWRWMTSNTGEPNRLRKSVYRRLLEENGFAILRFETTHSISLAEVERIRPRLAAPFRNLPDEELTDTGIFIVARAL